MNRRSLFNLFAAAFALFAARPLRAETSDDQGCDCLGRATQRWREEVGEPVWFDSTHLLLRSGKTHLNGRFTFTLYRSAYPEKSAPLHLWTRFCPMCGAKYPEAFRADWGRDEIASLRKIRDDADEAGIPMRARPLALFDPGLQ